MTSPSGLAYKLDTHPHSVYYGDMNFYERKEMDSLNLRAELAMRLEDLRIARKHQEEAAARPYSTTNAAAFKRAVRWTNHCATREQEARGRVIRASLAEVAR